ncbi:MAG TPA: cation-translocating P-type ATPase C-terminal domain-containing protein, partial [Polyangium sp.]|nr:cation-translocating P-type ATPase C-terminal domain-containing protein [Polyangium sp.]
ALAFSVLALSPLFHAWSCRSPILAILSMRPLVSIPLVLACAASAAIHLVAILVPALRPVFKTYVLNTSEWLLLLGLSILVVPGVEIAKFIDRVMRKSRA